MKAVGDRASPGLQQARSGLVWSSDSGVPSGRIDVVSIDCKSSKSLRTIVQPKKPYLIFALGSIDTGN